MLIFDTSCSTVASGGIRVNGPSTRISSDATVLQLIRQLHRFLTKTKTKTKNKAVEPFFCITYVYCAFLLSALSMAEIKPSCENHVVFSNCPLKLQIIFL